MSTRSIVAALVAAALPACSGSTGPNYDPVIPASWAAEVTNPYFPLPPGTTWQYQSDTPDGQEATVTEVLLTTRTINGVVAASVHDQVLLEGELIEDTEDWYAQDADGNVWYLGEDTKEYENGQVVSTAGSWEWGVGGALPGIIMWADPAAHLREEYRQEFARGEAEDFAKVVAAGQSVTVPLGSFSGCLKTEDWNGLEPGVREYMSTASTSPAGCNTPDRKKIAILRAPRSRVWRALTDSSQFGTWFGTCLKQPFAAGRRIRGPITIPEYAHLAFEVTVHLSARHPITTQRSPGLHVSECVCGVLPPARLEKTGEPRGSAPRLPPADPRCSPSGNQRWNRCTPVPSLSQRTTLSSRLSLPRSWAGAAAGASSSPASSSPASSIRRSIIG